MSFCRVYPIFIILCVPSGGAIARFIGSPVLKGMLIGLAVGFVPLVLLGIIVGLSSMWTPDRPICRCGKCKSADYEYVGPEELTLTEETFFEYRCPSCSREYGQNNKRFWEVSSDGTEIPYMVISKRGRWQIESTEAQLAADSDNPSC